MEKEISVRNLVEFIMKTGDLISGKNSQHTAEMGAKIHRRLQGQKQKANPNYQKEVAVKFTYKASELEFLIRGRIDGLYEEDALWVVDEIKTSEDEWETLTEKQVDLYFAQAMFYAYFLAGEKNLEQVACDLIYFEVLTENIQVTRRTFTKEALADFVADILDQYAKWYRLVEGFEETAEKTIGEMTFPYPQYRKGQHQLMGVVYKSVMSQKQLFLQAPTGTGKTISTLFPALKVLAAKKIPRIFYLTAKTITRTVAEEGLLAMHRTGLKIKTVTITAKDKISFPLPDGLEAHESPYSIGYYDRVNEGLWDILSNEDFITRPVIENYAKKHSLDPFEFSLDIALFCQVVICDYNYVYDPLVYLRRFFEEVTEKNAPLLLVDEAHNLVSRAKEMYSATLSLKKTQAALKYFKTIPETNSFTKKGRRLFNKVVKLLKEKKEEQTVVFATQKENWLELMEVLTPLVEFLLEYLPTKKFNEQQQVLDWTFEARGFLKIGELFDEEFVLGIETDRYDFLVKIICLDPAKFLEARHQQAYSSILFSATLSPMDYFKERLGAVKPVHFSLSSPFPRDHQQVIIADYIETTFYKRAENIEKIVDAIYFLATSQTGNYFVFCPSTIFMEQIYEAFSSRYNEKVILLKQEPEMTEIQREEFLEQFKENPEKKTNKSLVAFALLGGIFSEGIDLKGTRLIGTAIVGVGLPQINPVLDLEKNYYQEKNGQGFAYAYQLPGMNKVLQAVGRVIRTPEDYGLIFLLDERFLRLDYQKLLPVDWQVGVAHNALGLQEGAQAFWQQKKTEQN